MEAMTLVGWIVLGISLTVICVLEERKLRREMRGV